MKILSLSNQEIWPYGENKGIPSIYQSQKGFLRHGHETVFVNPLKVKDKPLEQDYEGIQIKRFPLPFGISSRDVDNLSLDKFWPHVKSFCIYTLEWFFLQFALFFKGYSVAKAFKPDLIYVHALNGANAGWVLSRIFKTKLVFRVYGVKELYWNYDDLWYRFKELRNYWALKLPADLYIFTDDGTCGRQLAIKLGIAEEKVRMWRNGIDFDFKNNDESLKTKVLSELGAPGSAKIILSSSRLNYYKGVDRLVHALPELMAKNKDCVCIIAGEGPDKSKLEKFCQKRGITDRVFFLGTVSKNTLMEYLNVADVFVTLSRFSNSTNTTWEAMVCGCCIVATEDENLKEALISGENSVLLSQKDDEKIVKVLSELLSDDQKRRELGDQAETQAKKVLQTWEQRIDQEVQLVEKMVGV